MERKKRVEKTTFSVQVCFFKAVLHDFDFESIQDKRRECSEGKLRLVQLQQVEHVARRERVGQTML